MKNTVLPDAVEVAWTEGNRVDLSKENARSFKRTMFGIRSLTIATFSIITTILGIIGGVSGIYEIGYAANVAIDAPVSDPKFAFEYPFKLVNNSHVFAIADLTYECKAIVVESPRVTMKDVRYRRGSISSLDRGGYGWLDCAMLGPNSHVVSSDEKPEVNQAKLEISVS